MKVKKIIKYFQDYKDQDTEVIVAWWDKSFVEDMEEVKLTDEQWAEIADRMDRREWCDVNDHLAEIIREVTGR